MARPRASGPGDRIWQVLYLAAIPLVSWLAGWHGWMTLASIAVAVVAVFILHFITAFIRGMIRDTWPRGVPPELTEQYMMLEQDGWQLPRVHRWWRCGEARPHLHLVRPGTAAGKDLILIWNGTTHLDAAGNVVRHEP